MSMDYDADIDEGYGGDDLTPLDEMVEHALDKVGHRSFDSIDPDVKSSVRTMARAFLEGSQSDHHKEDLRDMLIREHKIAAGVAKEAAKEMYLTMGAIAHEYRQDMN